MPIVSTCATKGGMGDLGDRESAINCISDALTGGRLRHMRGVTDKEDPLELAGLRLEADSERRAKRVADRIRPTVPIAVVVLQILEECVHHRAERRPRS